MVIENFVLKKSPRIASNPAGGVNIRTHTPCATHLDDPSYFVTFKLCGCESLSLSLVRRLGSCWVPCQEDSGLFDGAGGVNLPWHAVSATLHNSNFSVPTSEFELQGANIVGRNMEQTHFARVTYLTEPHTQRR